MSPSLGVHHKIEPQAHMVNKIALLELSRVWCCLIPGSTGIVGWGSVNAVLNSANTRGRSPMKRGYLVGRDANPGRGTSVDRGEKQFVPRPV